ncbi:MAG: tetratricopeptide repeat protein [Sphingobacteriia bacterium]|nr:tetratricopeptide repeat protein [Sphingobacteriia bacterium]NCC38880.1 tetratricopeptide repeat protein [Gammaproteobacteria bacterium]
MSAWMRARSWPALLLLAPLLHWQASPGMADALDPLPQGWAERLRPIPETDLSGAERLVRDAIGTTRAELSERLLDPASSADQLAEYYGRLGALFLLVEVETLADACLRNAAVLQPEVFRWPYYRGYLAMLAGRLDESLTAFETARAIDPDYAPLDLRRGKVLLDAGRLDEARLALEGIAETPGLEAAAAFHLGQIASLQRRHPEAVSAFERVLAEDASASGVDYPLALAYRAVGDLARAQRHLAKAGVEAGSPTVEDPLIAELEAVIGRSQPAFNEALHAVRNGDYATAATRFGEGLAIAPDNHAARVSHARALYLSGARDAAEEALGQVLEQDPTQTLARFLMGVLNESRGALDLAELDYQDTLRIDPRHAGAAFYLANLQFRQGRYPEAAASYRMVLESADPVEPARLLELIARARAGTDEAEILRRLEAWGAPSHDDPMRIHALARLLAGAQDPALRDPTRALALARDLVRRQPIPPFQRTLALALMSDGQTTAAIDTLQSVIAEAAWSAPPSEVARLLSDLEDYRAGRLPMPAWPQGDLMLEAPPLDPVAAFRDYPAAVPY